MTGPRDSLALAVVLPLLGHRCRFGAWAFGQTCRTVCRTYDRNICIGLFLFTRILIPDAMLTLTITWRHVGVAARCSTEAGTTHPRRWALVYGLLPGHRPAAERPYRGCVSRGGRTRSTWRSRDNCFPRSVEEAAIPALVAAHRSGHRRALARAGDAAQSAHFAFSLHSGPGEYRGFFWFYFINEHLLRFLNLRYPRDYNTVPRLWFWLLNLVWLFPWSAYLPAAVKLPYSRSDARASRHG